MILNILFDAFLVNLAFVLAYFFRFHILIFITPDSLPIFEQYLSVLVFVTLTWLAIFKLIGLYESKRETALIDDLANLFLGLSLSSLTLFGLLFLYRDFWFSRLVIANAWWISFVLLAVRRIASYLIKSGVRKMGWGLKNTLLIGAGEMGQLLAKKLTSNLAHGYRVVGFLDDDPAKTGRSYFGLPVFGGLERVKEMIVEHQVEEVIIAITHIEADRVLDIITECERFKVQFKLVPGILELIASRIDADEIAGVPLLTVSEIRLQGFNAAVKRSADVLLSLTGILLISPIYLVFGLLVKLTSPGPILFNHNRVGLDEKLFPMFKFRSMVANAEEMLAELKDKSEAEGNLFKIKNDPRMTPLGKFMRRFSVDELPQLFNVLFGQMSLVGPRPPLPREVEKYSAWHKKRLRVRPGITGPWQVAGRSLLPFDDMVRLDIYYIENWSLWLDIKILLRTIPVVLFGSGAY
ncbi:MAG: sugar transferase [bacterium]